MTSQRTIKCGRTGLTTLLSLFAEPRRVSAPIFDSSFVQEPGASSHIRVFKSGAFKSGNPPSMNFVLGTPNYLPCFFASGPSIFISCVCGSGRLFIANYGWSFESRYCGFFEMFRHIMFCSFILNPPPSCWPAAASSTQWQTISSWWSHPTTPRMGGVTVWPQGGEP